MRKVGSWLMPLTALVAAAYGLYRAIALAWLCDDAFISFRYAHNLVAGHGLVFNIGEYVEGYTNFLWTLLIAAAIGCGLGPESAAQVLGVLCYLGTVVLLLAIARRGNHRSRCGEIVPVGALVLGLHHHASSMASFGLETAMFTLLLTAALLALTGRRYLVAGVWLTLATLTRPDGALPYAVAWVVVLFRSGPRLQQLWRLAAPGVLVGVPYLAWKLHYYGDLLPNTFYAKSAADPYPGQGLWYVGLYFLYYPVLALGLVAPLVWLWRGRGVARDQALWITAFALPYLLYVVWIGGDFMFARFCLPVTPALCLGLQLLVPILGAVAVRVAMVIVVAGLVVAQAILEDAGFVGPRHLQIAEERNYYGPYVVPVHEHLGRYLHERLAGQQPVLAVGGAMAMLAYYCKWPTVIELNGLTDPNIARRPLERRGRVGHEKSISFTDPYLHQRGVHFLAWPFLVDFPKVGNRVPEHLRQLTFVVRDVILPGQDKPHEIKLTMLTYSRRLMDPLVAAEDVRFTPFPGFLDGYIQTIGQRSKDEVRLDYADFKRFYFDHNADRARQAAFEAFLR